MIYILSILGQQDFDFFPIHNLEIHLLREQFFKGKILKVFKSSFEMHFFEGVNFSHN